MQSQLVSVDQDICCPKGISRCCLNTVSKLEWAAKFACLNLCGRSAYVVRVSPFVTTGGKPDLQAQRIVSFSGPVNAISSSYKTGFTLVGVWTTYGRSRTQRVASKYHSCLSRSPNHIRLLDPDTRCAIAASNRALPRDRNPKPDMSCELCMLMQVACRDYP